ncbi:MAG: trimethylamine methyltransferase family protein [Candidatus Bathyarchaeota archaeon]|nr:trimethylamine methyltransferase family protein [Candidatus Bathyarchaeota archaeon]
MIKLNIPKLKLLTKKQLEDIHNATLEVLHRTGVVFKHPEALKIFEDAGAHVDHKSQRVFIPSYLVKEAIRKAPTRFTWHARNPKKSIKLEDDRIHFGPVCTPAFVYDLETYQKRYATLKDFENIVRLMDYLERVDDGYGVVHIRDVPEGAAHAYALFTQLKNTDKCIRGRARGTTIAKDCLKMMSMLSSEEELTRKPMLICMINPTSPLQWDTPMIEGMMEYVKLKQIVTPSPEIMAGATGPVTLAGTMVQHNAENLSMITLMQLMNPGTPVLYGAVSTVMDMRTTMTRLGSPELGITHAGFAQLAKRYNIPSRGAAGSTDSKVLDIQAGYETAFNLILATCAGFNFITYALGAIDFSLSVCYHKILTDHELLGMIERLVRGVEVSDETLAVDVIDTVGPGGHFLAQRHTIEHHTEEHFIPKLFDTQPYDRWLKAGSKEIRERAREEVKRILREHQPPPLDKDLEKKLEEYVKAVEKRETRIEGQSM